MLTRPGEIVGGWPDDADPVFDPMAHEKPASTLNQIDKAGRRLFESDCDTAEARQCLIPVWNWRAAHGYPLEVFHRTLRSRALRIDPRALTARRLKRNQSIWSKLARQPKMQLSQMQDIGGCRAIVSYMEEANALLSLYQSRPVRHELSRTKDYIFEPKDDGYRSIHLMYRFRGSGPSLPWDRLRIEVQIRTELQHAWATAVETVDYFTGQDLKSGGGRPEWRRFFALVGAMHAMYENTPSVPGTPESRAELLAEIKELERELGVVESLRSFAQLTRFIMGTRTGKDYWYVVELRPEERSVAITTFPPGQFERAKETYSEAEQAFQGTRNQAVLVSVASLEELESAYPNYFADTEYFTSVLADFLLPTPTPAWSAGPRWRGSLLLPKDEASD